MHNVYIGGPKRTTVRGAAKGSTEMTPGVIAAIMLMLLAGGWAAYRMLRGYPAPKPIQGGDAVCAWCGGDGKERQYDANFEEVPCDEPCFACRGTGLKKNGA